MQSVLRRSRRTPRTTAAPRGAKKGRARGTENGRAPSTKEAGPPGRRTGPGQRGRAAPVGTALLSQNRRRPTLPGPRGPSTIGAEGLNFSVRNGQRCIPLAITTERLRDQALAGPLKTAQLAAHMRAEARRRKITKNPSSPRTISTGLLSASLRLHIRPITWWSSRGLTPSRGWESSSQGRLPA